MYRRDRTRVRSQLRHKDLYFGTDCAKTSARTAHDASLLWVIRYRGDPAASPAMSAVTPIADQIPQRSETTLSARSRRRLTCSHHAEQTCGRSGGDLQDQCGLLASRKRFQRSTGSRRSAPWNGSTHPGYSGARALTSSNCLSSSWVSVSSTAARLS